MFFIDTGRVFRATIRQKAVNEGQALCELESANQFVVKFGDKFVSVEFLGNYANYKEISSHVGKDGKVKENNGIFLSVGECNSENEYIKEIEHFYFSKARISNKALIRLQADFTGLGPIKQVKVTPLDDMSECKSSVPFYEKTDEAERAINSGNASSCAIERLGNSINRKIEGGYSDINSFLH